MTPSFESLRFKMSFSAVFPDAFDKSLAPTLSSAVVKRSCSRVCGVFAFLQPVTHLKISKVSITILCSVVCLSPEKEKFAWQYW